MPAYSPRSLEKLARGVVGEQLPVGLTRRAVGHGVTPILDRADLVVTHMAGKPDPVMDIARQIAVKAPLAMYGSKRIINYARDHNTADTLDYIGIWNASMLQPAEISEAITATTEKREGDFADLPSTRLKMGSDIVDS